MAQADAGLFVSLTPTLSAKWLAGRMVKIIESGLSDHLVAPGYAAFMLPNLRAFPEWFRWIVNTVSDSARPGRVSRVSQLTRRSFQTVWQDAPDHHRRWQRETAQDLQVCRRARRCSRY